MQILDIHLLVTLATAGAIALADYGEAAAVVVLFAVAEHWERCSSDKVYWPFGGRTMHCMHCRRLSCWLWVGGGQPWQHADCTTCPGRLALLCLPCTAMLGSLQARDAVTAVLTLRPESGELCSNDFSMFEAHIVRQCVFEAHICG